MTISRWIAFTLAASAVLAACDEAQPKAKLATADVTAADAADTTVSTGGDQATAEDLARGPEVADVPEEVATADGAQGQDIQGEDGDSAVAEATDTVTATDTAQTDTAEADTDTAQTETAQADTETAETDTAQTDTDTPQTDTAETDTGPVATDSTAEVNDTVAGDSSVPAPIYGGLTEPCDGAAACPAGKVCDPAAHACVGCLTHSDCGGGALCLQQTCKKTAVCKSDKDCKTFNQVCDMKASACTDCVQQADCAGGQQCLNGQCKDTATCKSSKDCKAGICDAASGSCVDCVQSSDCDAGQFCIAGANLCANALCQGGTCSGDSWFACLPDGSGYAAAKPCQDGNFCTADSCKAGGCVYLSTAATCQDANPCTADGCDPAKGCTHSPTAGACDDGQPCTQDDACKAGNCQGTAANCDDANSCTEDNCAGKSGCVHAPIDAKSCNADDNPCTALDSCSKGVCTAGVPKVCPGLGPCSTGNCEIATGMCKYSAAAGSCDDGNPCTASDACADGVCAGGKTKSCDDKNPCTADTCDSKGECSFAPSSGPCEDGNPCTSGDSCSAGSCAGQPIDAAKVCDDSNPCTGDACSPVGGCTHLAKAGQSCSDGSDCTSGDSCGSDGKCKGGTSVCTCKTDADCAATQGSNLCLGSSVCETTPGAGSKCVLKAGSEVKCDSSKDGACAANTCVPATGKCAMAPKNSGGPCDDGDSCTANDSCKDGGCAGSAGGSCTDNDECTLESCVSGKGCTTTGSKTCNDGNPCTIDYCKSPSGCATFQNIGSCEDGDACTTGDTCSGNACKSGGPLNCDDKNDCTADSCDAKLGCQHAAVANKPCSDGDSCTSGDACANGVCKGAVSATCDDGNPCTKDVCGTKGCESTPLADGDSCGSGQVCKTGLCVKFCLNDGMCPGGCVCGTGTCAYPEWTVDGELPFTPGDVVGYHPYYDEYWSASVVPGAKLAITRYDTAGKVTGSFEVNNLGGFGFNYVNDLAGDLDSPRWYMVAQAGNQSRAAGFKGPGEPEMWSLQPEFQVFGSSYGGLWANPAAIAFLGAIKTGDGYNPVDARDKLTGKNVDQGKGQFVPGMTAYNAERWGDKILVASGSNSPTMTLYKDVTYLQLGTKFGLVSFRSIVVRKDRICLASKGSSTCYAMAKACK